MKRVVVVIFLAATHGAIAQLELTSFHSNGTIAWTNSETPAICHVEWASSPMGTWYRTWMDLTGILMTNSSHTSEVPMILPIGMHTGRDEFTGRSRPLSAIRW